MTTLLDLALTPAQGGPRECGPGRQAGCIYAECGFSPGGAPLEHFLVDYPQPINLQKLGLSAQGVTLVEHHGVWHILDIVGREHYPHAADLIEEGRAIGFSRKIPRTADFSKLTAHSTLILIHPEGAVTNAAALAPFAPTHACPCGKGHDAHEPCAGWHWYAAPSNLSGLNQRKLKRTRYAVKSLLPGAPEMTLTSAYVLRLPISNLSVIRGPQGQVNADSRRKADRAALPVIDADT